MTGTTTTAANCTKSRTGGNITDKSSDRVSSDCNNGKYIKYNSRGAAYTVNGDQNHRHGTSSATPNADKDTDPAESDAVDGSKYSASEAKQRYHSFTAAVDNQSVAEQQRQQLNE